MPVIEKLTNSLAQKISLGRLPPPEPGIFTGNPLAYPGWKVAFETLIERQGIPSAELIYYLKTYLGGSARESVEGYILLSTDEAYEQTRALLDKRFGNLFIIANAFRDKLESWPKITGRDGVALRRFANFLRQCLTDMKTVSSFNVLNDDYENQKLLLKLPDWLVYRWGRIVAEWRNKHQAFPPFCEFVFFIVKEADIACDPVTAFFSKKQSKTELEHSNKFNRKRTTGTSFSTEMMVTKETDQNNISVVSWCALCNENHEIDSCKSFLAKSVSERKEFAREKRLCFGCLHVGHRSGDCKKRSKCKTCSRYHPTSLHGDLREETTTTPKETVGCSYQLLFKYRAFEDSQIGDKFSVWLSHCGWPESERLVYAMPDTQSDTTFILERTCDDLEIVGPSVNLMLSTMSSKDQRVQFSDSWI
ncbi:uncharacterized protein LOC121379790 [Gigantopelta aegis]|uniref:uncharacterized protein LOC121379790 n=1 Tax=Gigantopelta aegis TaxID=1735272 RepID=UPI001B888F78|nr:uncharacterized protein LOC121379790 [Gigantopelta aegis]